MFPRDMLSQSKVQYIQSESIQIGNLLDHITCKLDRKIYRITLHLSNTMAFLNLSRHSVIVVHFVKYI